MQEPDCSNASGNGLDLRALHRAVDERRRAEGLTWAAVACAVHMAPSTIADLRTREVVEADGVLQLLHWLGRPPESFVAEVGDAGSPRYRLPQVPKGCLLRWDTAAIHRALEARRGELGLTWRQVANQIGGVTPATGRYRAKSRKPLNINEIQRVLVSRSRVL